MHAQIQAPGDRWRIAFARRWSRLRLAGQKRAAPLRPKARIDYGARGLIGELADLRSTVPAAPQTSTLPAPTARPKKRLIHLEGVLRTGCDGRILFGNFDFTIIATACAWDWWEQAATRKNHALAIVARGDCVAEMAPLRGKIERADGLRMVYFDQNRQLDPDISARCGGRWRQA